MALKPPSLSCQHVCCDAVYRIADHWWAVTALMWASLGVGFHSFRQGPKTKILFMYKFWCDCFSFVWFKKKRFHYFGPCHGMSVLRPRIVYFESFTVFILLVSVSKKGAALGRYWGGAGGRFLSYFRLIVLLMHKAWMGCSNRVLEVWELR